MNESFSRTVHRGIKYVVQLNPNLIFIIWCIEEGFHQIVFSQDQSHVILIGSGQYNHKLEKTIVSREFFQRIQKKKRFD